MNRSKAVLVAEAEAAEVEERDRFNSPHPHSERLHASSSNYFSNQPPLNSQTIDGARGEDDGQLELELERLVRALVQAQDNQLNKLKLNHYRKRSSRVRQEEEKREKKKVEHQEHRELLTNFRSNPEWVDYWMGSSGGNGEERTSEASESWPELVYADDGEWTR